MRPFSRFGSPEIPEIYLTLSQLVAEDVHQQAETGSLVAKGMGLVLRLNCG